MYCVLRDETHIRLRFGFEWTAEFVVHSSLGDTRVPTSVQFLFGWRHCGNGLELSLLICVRIPQGRRNVFVASQVHDDIGGCCLLQGLGDKRVS
jgi:hypothetical protein